MCDQRFSTVVALQEHLKDEHPNGASASDIEIDRSSDPELVEEDEVLVKGDPVSDITDRLQNGDHKCQDCGAVFKKHGFFLRHKNDGKLRYY